MFVGKKCWTINWDTYSKWNALWFHKQVGQCAYSQKSHHSRGEAAKKLPGRKALTRISWYSVGFMHWAPTAYQTLCKVMHWRGREPGTQAGWQGLHKGKNTQHNSMQVGHLTYLRESRRTPSQALASKPHPSYLEECSFQPGCYIILYNTKLYHLASSSIIIDSLQKWITWKN